jgi:hypothetical protein
MHCVDCVHVCVCVPICVFYRFNFWTNWSLGISICRWKTTQRQAANFVQLVITTWWKCEIVRWEQISWSGTAPDLYSGDARFESWPGHCLSRVRISRFSSVSTGKLGDSTTNQAKRATFHILFITWFISHLNIRLCMILRCEINHKRIHTLLWCEADTSAV